MKIIFLKIALSRHVIAGYTQQSSNTLNKIERLDLENTKLIIYYALILLILLLTNPYIGSPWQVNRQLSKGNEQDIQSCTRRYSFRKTRAWLLAYASGSWTNMTTKADTEK